MRVKIQTTHGKPFVRYGHVFTPDGEVVDWPEKQIKELEDSDTCLPNKDGGVLQVTRVAAATKTTKVVTIKPSEKLGAKSRKNRVRAHAAKDDD